MRLEGRLRAPIVVRVNRDEEELEELVGVAEGDDVRHADLQPPQQPQDSADVGREARRRLL